jgi:hypothetical protein
VILEDMRSQFTVFGDALQSSREESACRFDQVDHRLDQHDARFASLERAALENGRDIREVRRDESEVRRTVDRIENALASKVNRDEVESIIQRVVARP